jgi:hypothetical protein
MLAGVLPFFMLLGLCLTGVYLPHSKVGRFLHKIKRRMASMCKRDKTSASKKMLKKRDS